MSPGSTSETAPQPPFCPEEGRFTLSGTESDLGVELAGITSAVPSTRATAAVLHIPSLDGMRAIAVMFVFVGHAQLIPFPGNFGVTLFFFLSGYLITTLMRAEIADTGTVSLRQFYLRRTLRILPPFYLVLWTTALLVNAGVFVGDAFPFPVFMQSMHLSNYQIAINGYEGYPLGTFAYWSLAVEEHFYLGFPLVYLWMRRQTFEPRKQALILAGVCAVVLAWRCLLIFGFGASHDRVYVSTDTRIDSILFGCILAIYGNPVLEGNRLTSPRVAWVLCPLAAAVLLATFVIPGDAFRETIRYTLQGLAIYPLFAVAIRYWQWGPFRLLNLAPVTFLGALSYSLYLSHEIVIYNLYPHLPLPGVLRAIVALGLSVGVATTIYYLVERPLARVRRRFSHRAHGSTDNVAPSSQTAIST